MNATIQEEGMLIDFDVPIEMNDGLVLRADVYRPVSQEPSPVLMSYGPYGKNLTFQTGHPGFWRQALADDPTFFEGKTNRYIGFENADPERWVPEGYAVVRVDSRGAGRSPGILDNLGPREAQDYYDCIEWAAAQPWSNGRVGTSGSSYYGRMQWYVGALRPPHLQAMYVSEASADLYRDSARHGGILCEFRKHWFAKMVEAVQHGLGSRGRTNEHNGVRISGDIDLTDDELRANIGLDPWQEGLAHRLASDPYYVARQTDIEAIRTPFVSVGSWGALGIHMRGNTEAFTRASVPEKWLMMVAGSGYSFYHSQRGFDHQLRFFNYFLKDLPGWQDEPRVKLQVRHADGTYHERDSNTWPVEGTRWSRLHLHPEAGILDTAVPPHPSQASYLPMAGGVTMLTAPFQRAVEFAGPISCRLWLSCETEDTDLFLALRLFAPDGSEVLFRGQPEVRAPVSQGWLRVSQRKLDRELSLPWRPFHAHDEVQLLTPGQPVKVEVEIWPTAIEIPAGYRLGLSVLGKDFDHGLEPARMDFGMGPIFMRGSGLFTHGEPLDRPSDTFGGRVTIYSGPDMESFLLLPQLEPLTGCERLPTSAQTADRA